MTQVIKQSITEEVNTISITCLIVVIVPQHCRHFSPKNEPEVCNSTVPVTVTDMDLDPATHDPRGTEDNSVALQS